MATFILAQIEAAISLFTSLIQHGACTARYQRNLEWLTRLQAKASQKVAAACNRQHMDSRLVTNGDHSTSGDDIDDGEDVDILGWRTRLIERAGQSQRNAHIPATPIDPQPQHDQDPSRDAETIATDGTFDSMDDLVRRTFQSSNFTANGLQLHGFWDPTLVHHVFGVSSEEPNVCETHHAMRCQLTCQAAFVEQRDRVMG